MQMNTYLTFDGQREAAFRFYAECLGGRTETMIPHAGTPAEAHVAPEWRDKIMHARLGVGDAVLMGSDARADGNVRRAGFSVAVHFEDVAEAERVFEALSAGATVTMPMQETFWTLRFGMLTDRY